MTVLGLNLAPKTAFWGHVGPRWGHFETISGHFRALLGHLGSSKMHDAVDDADDDDHDDDDDDDAHDDDDSDDDGRVHFENHQNSLGFISFLGCRGF